jgi:hypothetical protein
MFGLTYLRYCLAAPESPDAVVGAVCAHEFGHILQFKRGLRGHRVFAGQPTVKRLELHADYLCGYFAGMRKLQKPDFQAAVFATSRYAVGDTYFARRDHHGTPDERAAAAVRGFEVAYRERRRLDEAVQIGINYVSVL